MSSNIRQQRLAELLFEELSIMIASELEDPRVSLVRVTSVDVSRDLRNVKVYVSHDDDSVTKTEVLHGLRHAIPYLRREIASRCVLRAVPELLFYYDDTPENAARVDTLLRQIAQERESRPATLDSSAPGDGIVDNSAPENGALDNRVPGNGEPAR